MIVMNIFRSPCFIEDVIFSVAESIQKKNMVTANCVLRKNGLIELELNGWLLLKLNRITLEYIVDILTFEFRVDMS